LKKNLLSNGRAFFDTDSGAGGPLSDLGELHRSHFGIVAAAGLFRIVISMTFT